MRTLAVLHFHDGVVMTGVDDLLFLHFGMRDVVDECPSDTSTRTSVDEPILWTCVESIFAINELGVQHDVALLGFGA